jgi:ADP-ribose pyrophosphatase
VVRRKNVAFQRAWTFRGKEQFRFNEVDGKVDRRSFMGKYEVLDGVPRNPVGRTGMAGRGLLGKWGPNHAADPIVTRWKKNSSGDKVLEEGKPVLQFVAVERKDNGEWAIPGGMVDPGENVSVTLKREFCEEALSSLTASSDELDKIRTLVNELFAGGKKIYEGYVDDPRNTDNAWMETVAMNFHDDTGDAFDRFDLKAGDDAAKVSWVDVSHELKLYASHSDFICQVAKLREAYY